MDNADQLLDEILAQIRGKEVPAFPREMISAKHDAARKARCGESSLLSRSERRRTGDGEVASAPVRRRAWQWLTAGALAVGLLVSAVLLFSAVESGKALAFAEVQKAISATRTMRYRVLTYSNNPGFLTQYNLKAGEPTVCQIICSGNRIRNEQPLFMVSIADYDKGVVMFITPLRVSAVISPIYESAWQPREFGTKLRNIPESDAKRLPDRELDGRRVNEFLVRMYDQEYTVTVDPKTKLPIRIQIGQGENRMVFTDFEFDIPVDESLFRMEAPEGYHVSNRVPRNNPPQPPESMELVVSPEGGIGPVKFGTKVEDIVRLLGEPDWRDDEEDDAMRTELGYDRRGFRLIANAKWGLYEIHCFNKRRILSTEIGFRGKTKEGIALDASLEEVLTTYGKPDEQLDSHLLSYRKRGYDFWFRDKKLVSIWVSKQAYNIELEMKGKGIITRSKAPK